MWVRISSFVNGQSDKMSDEMGFHIINIQIFDPYLRGAIEIFGSDGKWNTVSIRSGTLDWMGFAVSQHAYIPLADCYFHLVTGKKGQVAGKSKHWKWFPSFGLLSPWIKAQRRLWKPSSFDVPRIAACGDSDVYATLWDYNWIFASFLPQIQRWIGQAAQSQHRAHGPGHSVPFGAGQRQSRSAGNVRRC